MSESLFQITQAIKHLKAARTFLTNAPAPQTLKKVRSALKSAEGAERHAYGRFLRENRS